jgi:SAM-dependent methyltransferase
VTAEFKDHFSTQSAGYARFRPSYPDELFHYLASLTGEHANANAWDCATGNGQVAIALTEFFQNVVASDASEPQIAEAVPHPQVAYRVATAEESGLDDASVDLLTVGQAFHWFDQDGFFKEASRVLRAGGVLAIWCYEICRVTDACDAVVDHLYRGIIDSYWPAERALIEQGYDSVILPGEILVAPEIAMSADWFVADMLGYLRTWSACNRYEADKGSDPVLTIEDDLIAAWGDGARRVSWPMKLRVSRLNSLLE